MWETVQPVYDTAKNPFGLPIAPGDVMGFMGLQSFSVDARAETAAVMYSYPYGDIGAAVNKKGLIGNPEDRRLVVDTTIFGSVAAIDAGPQWPVL